MAVRKWGDVECEACCCCCCFAVRVHVRVDRFIHRFIHRSAGSFPIVFARSFPTAPIFRTRFMVRRGACFESRERESVCVSTPCPRLLFAFPFPLFFFLSLSLSLPPPLFRRDPRHAQLRSAFHRRWAARYRLRVHRAGERTGAADADHTIRQP